MRGTKGAATVGKGTCSLASRSQPTVSLRRFAICLAFAEREADMAQALKGIATISLWAADHRAAVTWYSELLETTPYFERPGYAEFRIGDLQTEVGVIDRKYAAHMAASTDPAGVVVYWHVDDVATTIERVLSMGARQLEAPQDRGNGFVTATVVDPFGNILGIMYNPHYVEMLGSKIT